MSPTASPILPARYFAILCDLLDASGVPCGAALEAAGLDRGMLNQANLAATPKQLEALLDAVRREGGRSDLAFEFGRRIKLNSHDILSCALISCSTLDHLLQLYSRYHALINPLLTMSYRRNGDDAELIFLPAQPMPDHVLAFCLEAAAVALPLQIRSAMQVRLAGAEVFVSLAAPPHAARYGELWAKVHFAPTALPQVRVRLCGAGLDVPLPMANSYAVNLAENRCKSLLRGVMGKGSWSDWVAMMLHHAEDCQPMLEDMAKLLNVTTRTLDRYLSKEGTSFRELSVRIRNQRARKLLDDGKMTVSQIAYTLGYTDLANFSRSFKKVCGVSPSVYKDELAQSSALRASMAISNERSRAA